MRPLALIIAFLLSFLTGGRTEISSASDQNCGPCNVSESQSPQKAADYTLNRDLCITAAQGYSFAGGESTNSVLVRVSQSGRRTSPQVRSSFRMVKGGKVIDNK